MNVIRRFHALVTGECCFNSREEEGKSYPERKRARVLEDLRSRSLIKSLDEIRSAHASNNSNISRNTLIYANF